MRIYKIISELAEQGVAIIMISSEMPEIIGMCDRVVVMSNGCVTGELDGEEITQENAPQSAPKTGISDAASGMPVFAVSPHLGHLSSDTCRFLEFLLYHRFGNSP